MRSVRRGVLIGSTLTGIGFVLVVAANCAAPTQITVEVHAQDELCDHLNGLTFSITQASKVGDWPKQPDMVISDPKKLKCGNGNLVGSLAVKPGDSESVGIRVVAAVNEKTDPLLCTEANQKDCIVVTKTARFLSGTNRQVLISLSPKCVNVKCPADQTCNDGECTDITKQQDDGGVTKDATVPITPMSDAGDGGNTVKPVDAGTDACVNCEGTGKTCTNGNQCAIDCAQAACGNATLCGPGLDCKVTCRGPVTFCGNTQCAQGTKCSFDCGGNLAGTHCANIGCDASVCNVQCADITTSCSGVTMMGAQNTMNCAALSTGTSYTCEKVRCDGRGGANGACKRTCDAGPGCADGGSLCEGNTGQCKDFELGDGG